MANLIDLLHQTAGISGNGHHHFGVYVMGAVSALYALALFSGVILLLPTLVKDFFAVRQGKNLKRFWLDTHNVIGITSLPFHIVITLAVIVFAFHDQFYDAQQKGVYGDRPLFERSVGGQPGASHVENLLMPAELVARVREISPEFTPREIQYGRLSDTNASARIAGENSAHMVRGANRGFVTFDPYTG
ncbi:MAG: PepSY domain-containing protein [Cellvibrionaceae bacterium]|nr:PepSY domain-containing protein [Cellvibrionaceae bacterium]